jgi:membrane-associated phospholipid phosphatase
MEKLLDGGVDVILWFQQFSPEMDLPFKILTFMGNESFFLLLLPLIYWCVDRRIGSRLIILFLLSAYINVLFKYLAGQPRPFTYDARVRSIIQETGGGLPSFHTQSTVVVWGYLVSQFRRPWLWALSIFLMVFIPISRVYLGVHFPTDLIGGYFIGVILLLGFLKTEGPILEWLQNRGLAVQLVIAAVIPLILVLAVPGIGKNGVTTAASLMGTGIGLVLENRWVKFETGGKGLKKVLRYGLGILVVFALWLGLRSVFAGLEPSLLFRFIRYCLIGLWASFGAPLVFTWLRLAPTRIVERPA